MNSHGDRLRLAPPSAKCDLGIVQGALRFTAKEESPDEGLLREYSLAAITGHVHPPHAVSKKTWGAQLLRTMRRESWYIRVSHSFLLTRG